MIKALDIDTPSYIIAFRDDVALSSADFQRHVAVLNADLQQDAASTVVLYCDDAYWFAVGLFAAWLAHKTIALPGDSLAATQIAGRPLGQAEIEAIAVVQTNSLAAKLSVFSEPNLAELQYAQLMVYTSGSSGQAKAIPKSLQQLLNEVAALELQFGALLGDSVVLGTVSHQHIYGLLFRVLWPLVQGRAFAAQAAFFPETLMQQSQTHQRVIWVSSPAHYKRLTAAHDWQGIALHLAGLFSSGGILPIDVAQAVLRYSGLAIQEIFGSSETGGVAYRQSAGATWCTLPKVKIQVSAEGALQIQSPHLSVESMPAQHVPAEPALAEPIPAEPSNWYTMDDAVRLHPNGRFELLGRLDRVVKIEEKRFSLLAIEQALLSLVEVKDAAVFADHEQGREYIAAVLVLHQDDALQSMGKYRFCEQLKQQLQPMMAQLALPRRWRFVAELPMNAQGKLSQAALKALFEPVALLPRVVDLQQGVDVATLQLHIDANIAYFSGHFQHMPVLPGVTQIHWAVQFARQQWPIPAQFERMEVIKFQNIIQPDCQVQLQLDWDGSKLRFAYTSEAGAHSSGRLIFTPQGDA